MSDLKRGNMLWEGSRMMLPEHKQAILDRKQQQQLVPKPSLDEQKLNELDEVICEAMAENQPLHFKYYQKGKILNMTGKVGYYDEQYKQLRICDLNGNLHILNIENVIDAEIR